jgi:hypothetical protein
MVTHIQGLNGLTLENIAHEKGKLAVEFDRLSASAPTYSPPEWIDLSIIINHRPNTTTAQPTQQPSLYDPTHHMGIPRQEFINLPHEQQKQMAMARLPPALASITTTDIIISILTTLRETPHTRMLEFLDPTNFDRHLNPTNKAGNSVTCNYRYRLQQIRGKSNTLWSSSPGHIISHWLQAVTPLILPHSSFTLIHPPHHNDPTQIQIMSPKIIPNPQVLASYANDTHFERNNNNITHVDLWFSSSHPELTSIIPRTQDKNADKIGQIYITNLLRGAMRATKQEQFPIGMEPCVVLIGSNSRDSNEQMLAEFLERMDCPRPEITSADITWMTIRTRLDRCFTMAKCVLASPNKALQVRHAFANIHPPAPQHLITHELKIIVIPPESDPNYDRIMSPTITEQISSLESTTNVSFLNLTACDPFSHIPTLSLMADSDLTSINTKTIATLIIRGRITLPNGMILHSPVKKVAADLAGSRLYLFAPKRDAEQLISFAEHVLSLLPTWLNQVDKVIQFDPTEARRALRDTHQISSPNSSVTTVLPTHTITRPPPPPPNSSTTPLPHPPPSFPPPPPHPSETRHTSTNMTMTVEQYDHIMGKFSTIFHRMDKTDAAIAELREIANTSNNVLTHAGWSEDIISAITTTLTNESDSIRVHQLQSLNSHHSTIRQSLDQHSQSLADQEALLKLHIDNVTTAQSASKTTDAHHTELLNSTIETINIARRDVTALVEHTTHTHLTTTPNPNGIEGATPSKLSSRTHAPLPTDKPSPQKSPPNLSIAYDDGDGYQPTNGDCTACHEYSDDLKICYRCELPFDYKCILSITNKLTNEADYQCVRCHHATKPASSDSSDIESTTSSPLKHASETDESDTHTGLTDSDSEHSSPSAPETPQTTQSKQSPPTHSNQPSTNPGKSSTRKSPHKTRNYVKSIATDPPDPDHA